MATSLPLLPTTGHPELREVVSKALFPLTRPSEVRQSGHEEAGVSATTTGFSVGGGSKLRAAFSAVGSDVVVLEVGRVLCVGAGGDLGCDPAMFEPPNDCHHSYHHYGQDDATHDVLGLTVDRVADRNSGTSHDTSSRYPFRVPVDAVGHRSVGLLGLLGVRQTPPDTPIHERVRPEQDEQKYLDGLQLLSTPDSRRRNR